MTRLELTPLFSTYLKHYPHEATALDALKTQLLDEPTERLSLRSNMRGHATGSVAIVDLDSLCMLEIFHNTIGLWLTPGGHVDPGETPREAALREAFEEVAADPDDLIDLPELSHLGGLLDMDTHLIEPNPKKNEGAHFHYDFLFVFARRGLYDPALALSEVSQYRWTPISFYLDSPSPRRRRVAHKLATLFPHTPSLSAESNPYSSP